MGGAAGGAGGPGYATATVKAVDWERNEITLPYQPGMEKDFPVGRYLRVYNWGRSAMCRILSATRQGKELRLALDTTALLAQGPVVKTADGAIFVGDTLLFANGRADDKGVLPLGNDYFAGSFLSDGKSTHQLAGAVRDNPTKLYLKQPLPQADLEKVFAGKIVRVWQYGVGDTVEIARVK